VLVRIEHSGICGKQIDEITGRQGEDRFIPHLLGHEGGGEVLEIGPGVKKVKPGDRVVMHWVKGSGIDSPPPRFSYKGQVLSAGWVTTFSSHTIASENRLTPVDKALKDLSRGNGFDAVVDTTGLNRLREIAYDATRAKSGVTVLCGVPFSEDRLSIDSFPLHMGRRLIGSHGGDAAPDTDIPRY